MEVLRSLFVVVVGVGESFLGHDLYVGRQRHGVEALSNVQQVLDDLEAERCI